MCKIHFSVNETADSCIFLPLYWDTAFQDFNFECEYPRPRALTKITFWTECKHSRLNGNLGTRKIKNKKFPSLRVEYLCHLLTCTLAYYLFPICFSLPLICLLIASSSRTIGVPSALGFDSTRSILFCRSTLEWDVNARCFPRSCRHHLVHMFLGRSAQALGIHFCKK